MSKLSEKEIIIECNKLLITLKNSHIDGKIIQILYDLYEQEKEKNKRYEKYLKNKDEEHEKVLEYIEIEKEQDYISKDKIRELKKFYINDCVNRNITLIPLKNLVANINILLEEK